MNITVDALFSEIQSAKPGWLSFFIIGLAGFATVMAVIQLFFRVQVGTNPAPNSVVLIIWIGVGFLLPILFFTSNLQVAVSQDGIHYRYFPFHVKERVLKKEEIREFHQVTYDPVKDYGGYGIRWSRKGRAYNVNGDKGVRVTTKEGKDILFGTQVPGDFENALHSIF